MADVNEAAREILDKVINVYGISGKDQLIQMSQLMKIGEEAGELQGAYLRAAGLSRRDGSWKDFELELADVVITAHIIAAACDIDLDAAIEEKLAKVYTRGWKEDASGTVTIPADDIDFGIRSAV